MEPRFESDRYKLPLENMAARHYGLPTNVADYLLDAARVCLDRHHTSPTDFSFEDDTEQGLTLVEWEITDERTRWAYNNESDATRDGAYLIAIAALEMLSGFVAIKRAETLTGSDYYVAPKDAPHDDLEEWWRLEVSGTDLSRNTINSRLRKKVTQVQDGQSNLPAIATVVGFKERLIIIRTVQETL